MATPALITVTSSPKRAAKRAKGKSVWRDPEALRRYKRDKQREYRCSTAVSLRVRDGQRVPMNVAIFGVCPGLRYRAIVQKILGKLPPPPPGKWDLQ